MPTPGNAINEATTGITGFTGTAFVGTPVTQYNVITGAATSSTLNNVAPSATSGVPLISQGAASQPVFGTVAIAGGGTNATSFTQSNGIVTYNGTSLVNYAGPQIDSSGRQTNTTQPAFLVFLETTVTNVTGDGTIYTVIYDTEVFDQGSNFNLGTGTFTAPVTGKYQTTVGGSLLGGTVLSAMVLRITTSNRVYRSLMFLTTTVTTSCSSVSSVLADMDSGDTLIFTLQASDSGGKVDDASGTTGGEIRNWASSQLTI